MKIGKASETNSSGKYFGTDGFRGEPNVTLSAEHAFKVGRFLGWYYRSDRSENKPRILIGKDTRKSSYMLEYAIAAGITASGADAYLMHVTTTPSISYICRKENFSCGVMITASHNPYYDNGIKVINNMGEKLDDRVTSLIESYLDGNINALIQATASDLPLPTRDNIGIINDYTLGRDKYTEYLVSLVHNSLNNMRIGIDCANGASWMIGAKVFSALGADTHVIGDTPNGTNINEGVGSTHIEKICDLVTRNKLDVGFAFDGDADRCIAIDSSGEIIDGDKILYILAKRFKRENILTNDTVAVTIMSNLGVINALKTSNISSSITPVGDKYVYQRMIENEYQLGGEQSGHIIMRPYASTGDGLLTALILADEMITTQKNLSQLCKDVFLFPQRTENLKVIDKKLAAKDEQVTKHVEALNNRLHPNGRVLIRASGTENVLRITAEAEDITVCNECIAEIKSKLQERGYIL